VNTTTTPIRIGTLAPAIRRSARSKPDLTCLDIAIYYVSGYIHGPNESGPCNTTLKHANFASLYKEAPPRDGSPTLALAEPWRNSDG
jgi:hypothetical protein